MPLDLPFAYRQSESRIPIVLLYTQEANMVEKLVIEGAQKKQVRKLFTRSRLYKFDKFPMHLNATF